MPTNRRVRSAIITITEALEDIGYELLDLIGPVDRDGEEISEDEVPEHEPDVQYYLTGQGRRAKFYIRFSLNRKFANIVYPMDVLGHLGSYLERDEIEALLDQSIDWESVDLAEVDSLAVDAAERVVSNTDPIEYHTAAFNLSAYASTALVDYRQVTTNNGFPTEFQCSRGLFPYTEQMTIKELDDRLEPVLVAGERGRRYMEYSFRIEKEDRVPEDYEFTTII